jgi:hypothetical protein
MRVQRHFFVVLFTDQNGKEQRGPILSTLRAARVRGRRCGQHRIMRQETTGAPMVEVR